MNDNLFTQELDASQTLRQTIFEEVKEEESTLAGGRDLKRGGTAFKELNETKVSFGYPDDRLIQLTSDLLQKMEIELDPIEAAQFENQFDYYYMAMPVSLFPKRGKLFNRVECRLDFRVDDGQRIIMHSIYPTSKWHKVIEWGGEMNLAMSGNLDWEIGVDAAQLDMVKQLQGVPSAKVKTNNEVKSRILMPNFAFELGRQEIVATGEGQNFAQWRLHDEELKTLNDIRFNIVFKVTKGVDTIRMLGKVQAEPNMNVLAAELDDVFSELSDNIKAIFRKKDSERKGAERLPVGDYEIWESLKLPRVN